jgi:hypothetical protein
MRGKIRNKSLARILRDYSGLRIGAITPTDLDGYFEINNKHFVFIEIKYHDAAMPYGQRLALERMVDAIAAGGKLSILILATHNVSAESDIEIDVASCNVTAIKFGGDKWRYYDDNYRVKQCVDDFLKL